MPNSLLIMSFVVLSNLFIFKHPLPEMDMVENTSIMVKNSESKYYSLGRPKELQKAFGRTSIIKSADEVLGGNAYIHSYNGLEVYFNESNFEAVTITKPAFQVLINMKIYKTGNQIQILKEDFPKSFKNRAWVSKDTGMVHIGITHKKAVTDAFIVFTFNSKGIITEIWIGNDNS